MSDYPEALSDAIALGEAYKKRYGGSWAQIFVKPIILADILKAWRCIRRLTSELTEYPDGSVYLHRERLALRISR